MTRPTSSLLCTLLLGLALGGCREEAAPPTAAAPGASEPSGPGGGTGSGGRQGMGFGGMQGMGFGGMQGMGFGGMQGMGMGGGGDGPTKFPPWHLTPEAQAELERRRAAMPAPVPPAGVAELEGAHATPPGRCPEHRRTHLYVFHGDTLVRSQPIAEAMAAPEAIEVPRGQGPPRRALPLVALLPAGATTGEVVVYPCVGESVRIPVEALKREPNRYSVVETPKGVLRLLDAAAARGGDAARMRNLAALVVL